MICDSCAASADSAKTGKLDDDFGIRCPHCWQVVRLTKKGKVKRHGVYDWNEADFVPCQGAGEEPVKIGHAYCEGCDCHHKPVGTGIPTE